MIEHGDAIREAAELRAVLVGLNQMIAQKDQLLEKLKDRDARRRGKVRELREELHKARGNIGELNSMLFQKDDALAGVRKAHEKQALTIAAQAQDLTSLGRRVGVLVTESEREQARRDNLLVTRTAERDKARAQVEELQGRIQEGRYWAGEDEDSDAPNLALAACKKKLEQLEGMLEGQRRNTRELGANLQRVRDEKAAMKEDLRHKQRELDTANELSRQHQTQRDQQFQRAQEVEKRKDRALSLVRRAAAILDPPTVTEVKNPGVDWGATNALLQGIGEGRAKKTEPRPANAWRCAAMKDGHSCDQTYHHALGDGHHCHCGQWWGGK